jgi:hypothetical protein
MSVPFANDGSFLAQFLAMQNASSDTDKGSEKNKETTDAPERSNDHDGHDAAHRQEQDGVSFDDKSPSAPKTSSEANNSEATLATASASIPHSDADLNDNDGKESKKTAQVLDPAKKKSILSAFSTKIKKVSVTVCRDVQAVCTSRSPLEE